MTLLNIQISFAHASYLNVICLSVFTLQNVKYSLQLIIKLGIRHTKQRNTKFMMAVISISCCSGKALLTGSSGLGTAWV